ncbi:alpha/beta hydrolase [Seongchinamella unica]|uniref:Alpha/beta hydrolase n=1 Tax=Seongchinamella unica TaxID=2547392 RepID=A0A4R5LW45_9GAMM|nr:alpha/beta hydrolase [Seongchinamella unica]TDG15478.1 alpha/beta hydrolase [Seongchinamella unica]
MWLDKVQARLLRLGYRLSNQYVWRGKFIDHATSLLQIPGPSGPLAARLYSNTASGRLPLILYFHGGGWVIGDLDTHHPFCQVLAERSGATVLALDYRLAPEHPWPAAQADCLAASEWVAGHLSELGPNNGRLVIAGDSAGGNLTACSALDLGADARQRLAGAATLYPAADHPQQAWPSYREEARSGLLTTGLMRWFWGTYLGGTPLAQAANARPLRSTRLGQLPPLFAVTAERDPLRDEGQAFADAVRQCGVDVRHRHFAGAAHGFACSEGPTDDFNEFIEEFCDWLDSLE